MRVHFDPEKSALLRKNPQRGIGFEEAKELFFGPYYLDRSFGSTEQFRAVGWVGDRLFTVILEVRNDAEGEFHHFVTLWRATREEQKLYENQD